MAKTIDERLMMSALDATFRGDAVSDQPPASTGRGLRRWFSIIGALIMRDVISHGERQPPIVTLLIMIIEPVGVIAVFGSISYFMLRQSVYGPSTVLFHASGILPYYFFMRISARVRGFKAESANRLPCIQPIDEVISLVIIEYIIMTCATILILGTLAIFVTPLALPFNPTACLVSVTLLTLVAFGLNLVNSAISEHFEVWITCQIILNRGMMLVAGVFFVMDLMPPNIRWWLCLNPVAHAIMWFRTGLYPMYPDFSLDKGYLELSALFALVIGFIVERANRNFEGLGDFS